MPGLNRRDCSSEFLDAAQLVLDYHFTVAATKAINVSKSTMGK